MRSLTSVTSSNNVLIDIEFRATLTDASTTWVFDVDDISMVSPINWEVPFMGGFGKVSDYTITLQTSEGFNQNDIANFIRAETALKITANSDSFTPHVGRIRSIQRGTSDRNKTTFRVFDRFFDDDPTFPPDLISDVYGSPPVYALQNNIAQTYYYGQHSRGIFLTPVSSDFETLYTPKNVSSGNMVNSFEMRLEKRGDQVSIYPLNLGYSATSATWVGNRLEAFDVDGDDVESLFSLNTPYSEPTPNIDVLSGSNSFKLRSRSSQKRVYEYSLEPTNALTAGNDQYTYWETNFPIDLSDDFNLLNTASYSVVVSMSQMTTPVASEYVRISCSMGNDVGGTGTFGDKQVLDNPNSDSTVGTFDFTGMSSTQRKWISKKNASLRFTPSLYIRTNSEGDYGGGRVTFEVDLTLSGDMNPELYNGYNIFTIPDAPSDVAISENPAYIAAHICSESGIGFKTDQFSAAQSAMGNINFQCFFDKSESTSEIFDDFGQQIGQYFWAGDSGFLSTKLYMDGTTSVDLNLNLDEIVDNTLSIKENILGSSTVESSKKRLFNLSYDYDYTKGIYNHQRVDSYNSNDPTSYYHIMNGSGVKGKKTLKSKYIISSETAYNVSRIQAAKYAHDDTMLNFDLSPRYLGLEIADKISITSDYIYGEYQVVKLSTDYMTGISKVTATSVRSAGVR